MALFSSIKLIFDLNFALIDDWQGMLSKTKNCSLILSKTTVQMSLTSFFLLLIAHSINDLLFLIREGLVYFK